jgi:hypothetical protein
MTLLRRSPREVYRVYSEDEYLGGAGTQLGGIAEWHAAEPELAELGSVEEQWPLEEPFLPSDEPAGRHVEWDVGRGQEHRLRRAAGVAMLAGVLGAVGGLVCLNLARTHGGGAPRRGSLVAATRTSRVASFAPVADDARAQVESSRPVVVRTVETVRSRVARFGRSRAGGSAPRRSDPRPSHPPARRSANVAVFAARPRDRPSSDAASAASASASAPTQTSAPAQASASGEAPAPSVSPSAQPATEAAGTTTATASASPAHPSAETQTEFGFER